MATSYLVYQEVITSVKKVINCIRSSNLNFALQETPYSVFVTIRKSQKKSGTFSVNDQKINEQELVTLKNEFEFLQSKFKLSQDANEKLKSLYEDAVQETEENHRHIEYLETELSNVNEKLSETKADIDLIVTKKVKHISDEKRGIQVKHEKLCAEFTS